MLAYHIYRTYLEIDKKTNLKTLWAEFKIEPGSPDITKTDFTKDDLVKDDSTKASKKSKQKKSDIQNNSQTEISQAEFSNKDVSKYDPDNYTQTELNQAKDYETGKGSDFLKDDLVFDTSTNPLTKLNAGNGGDSLSFENSFDIFDSSLIIGQIYAIYKASDFDPVFDPESLGVSTNLSQQPGVLNQKEAYYFDYFQDIDKFEKKLAVLEGFENGFYKLRVLDEQIFAGEMVAVSHLCPKMEESLFGRVLDFNLADCQSLVVRENFLPKLTGQNIDLDFKLRKSLNTIFDVNPWQKTIQKLVEKNPNIQSLTLQNLSQFLFQQTIWDILSSKAKTKNTTRLFENILGQNKDESVETESKYQFKSPKSVKGFDSRWENEKVELEKKFHRFINSQSVELIATPTFKIYDQILEIEARSVQSQEDVAREGAPETENSEMESVNYFIVLLDNILPSEIFELYKKLEKIRLNYNCLFLISQKRESIWKKIWSLNLGLEMVLDILDDSYSFYTSEFQKAPVSNFQKELEKEFKKQIKNAGQKENDQEMPFLDLITALENSQNQENNQKSTYSNKNQGDILENSPEENRLETWDNENESQDKINGQNSGQNLYQNREMSSSNFLKSERIESSQDNQRQNTQEQDGQDVSLNRQLALSNPKKTENKKFYIISNF